MASDEQKLEQLKEKIKQELKAEILAEIAKGMKAEQEEPLNSGPNLDKSQKNEELTLPESVIKAEIQKIKTTIKEDITINAKTILKMASHAKKYANPKIPQHKWVEVLGILAGKFDDGILHIEDAYQMGHGNAIHAEIHDYKNYARAVTEINENGQFVCGWYHSHPTYGLFLSEEDMDTQRRYQKLWDKSVALVMDPYMIDGNSFGFEIFRSDFKKYFPCKFKTQGNLTPAELPELLEIINPILEGKNIYKEYDE